MRDEEWDGWAEAVERQDTLLFDADADATDELATGDLSNAEAVVSELLYRGEIEPSRAGTDLVWPDPELGGRPDLVPLWGVPARMLKAGGQWDNRRSAASLTDGSCRPRRPRSVQVYVHEFVVEPEPSVSTGSTTGTLVLRCWLSGWSFAQTRAALLAHHLTGGAYLRWREATDTPGSFSYLEKLWLGASTGRVPAGQPRNGDPDGPQPRNGTLRDPQPRNEVLPDREDVPGDSAVGKFTNLRDGVGGLVSVSASSPASYADLQSAEDRRRVRDARRAAKRPPEPMDGRPVVPWRTCEPKTRVAVVDGADGPVLEVRRKGMRARTRVARKTRKGGEFLPRDELLDAVLGWLLEHREPVSEAELTRRLVAEVPAVASARFVRPTLHTLKSFGDVTTVVKKIPTGSRGALREVRVWRAVRHREPSPARRVAGAPHPSELGFDIGGLLGDVLPPLWRSPLLPDDDPVPPDVAAP